MLPPCPIEVAALSVVKPWFATSARHEMLYEPGTAASEIRRRLIGRKIFEASNRKPG